MKTLFTIILVALLVGCEIERITVFYADPQLQPYVNSFFADAEKYGVPLPLEKRNAFIRVSEDDSAYELCDDAAKASRSYQDRAQRYVELNPVYSPSNSDPGTKGLVYRELWHLYFPEEFKLAGSESIEIEDVNYFDPSYPCYKPSGDFSQPIIKYYFELIKVRKG
jgi:hypothetical protein